MFGPARNVGSTVVAELTDPGVVPRMMTGASTVAAESVAIVASEAAGPDTPVSEDVSA